jgi:hypothetical protein
MLLNFIFVFLLFSISECQSQAEIMKTENLKGYSFNFDKLDNDEVLSYVWEESVIDGKKYSVKIFAEDKSKRRLIGYWHMPWGAYQFSSNRRSLVFFQFTSDYKNPYPLFYMDGNNGNVKYLFDVSSDSMTNNGLNYIMYHYGSNDSAGSIYFRIIDLHELKLTRTIKWNVHAREGGGPVILRSLNPEYDFRIEYQVEGSVYAECYYKIQTDELNVIFDDTGLSDERELKYSRSREELGYY